ncbi:hypothetical protein FACS1894191_3390 [Clostridia bacterium]|nr:hypothetical protein FACS1894191_3390 [Clostridia bacterium]
MNTAITKTHFCKKILALVLTAVMAFGLVPAFSLTASAASSDDVIDIADLTEDRIGYTGWDYTHSANSIGLMGNVTITGTANRSSRLYINSYGYTITLDNVSLTSSGNPAVWFDDAATLILVGDSSITSTQEGGAGIGGDGYTTDGDGTLDDGVAPITNAATPNITTQPSGADYTVGDTATALAVAATVSDSGTLSYQWYSNDTNDTTSPITVGTDSANFTPPTTTLGTTYYYCVVTNTNSGVNGTKTATAQSFIVAVKVSVAGASDDDTIDIADLGNANIAVYAKWDYTYSASSIGLAGNVTITGTANRSSRLYITSNGHTITLDNVTLTSSGNPAVWFDDAATLILVGDSSITSTIEGGAGIGGSNYTTDGDGTLNGAGLSTSPTITSITPNSGNPVGGTSVTLIGTNLTDTTAVTVGGNNATDTTNVSDTEITFTTPSGSLGAQDVKVTTSHGSATKTDGFTYEVIVAGASDDYIIDIADLTQNIESVYAGWDYNSSHKSITLTGNVTITGTADRGSDTLIIYSNSYTITLDNVTLTSSDDNAVMFSGDANLVLVGSSTITSTSMGGRAILASGTASLTVSGAGTLNATGGGDGIIAGSFTMNGGTVNTTGTATATASVGITVANGNHLMMNGGVLNAIGVRFGIGGMNSNLTMNGGTVTASGDAGAFYYVSNIPILTAVASTHTVTYNTANSSTGGTTVNASAYTHNTDYKYIKIEPIGGTPSLALGGSVSISGTAKYGATLTAVTTNLTSTPSGDLGTLSYEWKRGNTIIGAGAAYTIAQADIGNTITVTVTAANCTGSVTSSATGTIAKSDGPAAPGSVTGSYTGNGTTFTYTVTAISGAEYSKDGTNYQDSNVFTGFTTASGATTFYARIKETATVKVGAAGNTGPVTFAKLSDRNAPALDFSVSDGGFPKAVTITAVTGAEYSFNGGGYSATNTYTSNAGESLDLAIRLAATATHNASSASAETINTANQNQDPPASFTLTYTANGETNYTITIPATDGAEYSFDGSTWSGTNTTTALPGATVTGYKRMAAKSGFNVSGAVSDSVTLPVFQVQTPTATPDGGTFTTSQSVTLSTATGGAAIYYTTDGTAPTIGSTLYGGAFTLSDTATVKAIAVKTGMTDSAVLSVAFTKQTGETPPTLYALTVNGGTGSGDYAAGAQVTITANAAPSGQVFDKWTATGGGSLANANSASTTYTMPGNAATVTATYKAATGQNNTDDNNGDSSDNSGSGGGGGGGGGTNSTAPANTPQTVTTAQATAAAASAVATAKAEGASVVTVTLKNPGEITKAALDAIVKATGGLPVKVNADSRSADGKSVEVRITFDPAKATSGLNLSASTTNAQAKATEAKFEKWFGGNVSVVSLGQQGAFGQPVEIAAKIDPKLNKETLYFYAYDKKTNTYKRIPNSKYWVDKNGFVHFITELAGDIIITDGPLVKK